MAVNCNWCAWSAWVGQDGRTCGRTSRNRVASCPAASNGGAQCDGNSQDFRDGGPVGEWGDFGETKTQDFHRGADWHKNRFDVQCPGGCFEIIKVIEKSIKAY